MRWAAEESSDGKGLLWRLASFAILWPWLRSYTSPGRRRAWVLSSRHSRRRSPRWSDISAYGCLSARGGALRSPTSLRYWSRTRQVTTKSCGQCLCGRTPRHSSCAPTIPYTRSDPARPVQQFPDCRHVPQAIEPVSLGIQYFSVLPFSRSFSEKQYDELMNPKYTFDDRKDQLKLKVTASKLSKG